MNLKFLVFLDKFYKHLKKNNLEKLMAAGYGLNSTKKDSTKKVNETDRTKKNSNLIPEGNTNVAKGTSLSNTFVNNEGKIDTLVLFLIIA